MVLRRLALLLCLVVSTGAAPPAAVPRRIVSLNMCADQLLIALADRSQIAALTDWSRDPRLSFYAERARGYPVTHRSAEEVMMLRPDVVVGAPPRTALALAPLAARGVRMVDYDEQEGFAGIMASVRLVAMLVGRPERGERLIARMRAALAAIGPPPGRGRIAAFYQRNGYLTGTGTLVDEAMRRVGLVNLAGRLDKPVLSQLSLEELALARPDVVIMDTGARRVTDRGTALLHHPLLDRAVPASRRFYIPQALTVCGTPGYPQAVAMLATDLRAADGMPTGRRGRR